MHIHKNFIFKRGRDDKNQMESRGVSCIGTNNGLARILKVHVQKENEISVNLDVIGRLLLTPLFLPVHPLSKMRIKRS